MLTQQRHEIILELLREKGSITVTEVKDLLDTSESTVRRDITALDKEGKLEKVFGGAVELKERVTAYEYSVAEKMGLKLEEKDRIAKYAAGLIQDEDFVYIDAGTTTGDILKFLKVTRAVFVTNAVVHAQTLAGRGFKVLLVGGELKSTTEAVIGNQAMNTIRGYHLPKAFLEPMDLPERVAVLPRMPMKRQLKQLPWSSAGSAMCSAIVPSLTISVL